MSNLEKTCVSCGSNFYISENDLEFYRKISPKFGETVCEIPPPTHCPHCRQQRRLACRNEANLYKRKCAATGESIISTLSPDKPLTVYSIAKWWSDDWDGRDYGRAFDFSRPFFEQFVELQRVVPRLGMTTVGNENCDYAPHTWYSKDCYLCRDNGWLESCYYVAHSYYSQDLFDSTSCWHSNSSYECLECDKLYNCAFCEVSSELSDCLFCYDCRGCNDCLLSANLRRQRFRILNVQYTEAEYLEKKAEIMLQLQTESGKQALLQQFTALKAAATHRNMQQKQCENCLGDFLRNCKNLYFSFSGVDSEDAAFSFDSFRQRDTYDTYSAGAAELCTEILGSDEIFTSAFCAASRGVKNVFYSEFLMSSEDCFGCTGLKNAKYCILNQQYSKAEYEELVPKIIAHMQQTGEWGEFFPISQSFLAYNETVAHEYFPLEKAEVEARGWPWREPDVSDFPRAAALAAQDLPENIADVTDEILQQPILCAVSGKPFKIQKAELAFYRRFGLPLPRLHPNERYRARLAQLNPRSLWPRNCADCGTPIYTSFAPERPERVLCETCYEKAVI